MQIEQRRTCCQDTCFSSIPSGQGKYRQAVSAKAGGCSSGSSSSSGAENQKYRDPEAEIREELKRYKSAEKKQGVQDEPAGEKKQV